jgi:hypothetical protein
MGYMLHLSSTGPTPVHPYLFLPEKKKIFSDKKKDRDATYSTRKRIKGIGICLITVYRLSMDMRDYDMERSTRGFPLALS